MTFFSLLVNMFLLSMVTLIGTSARRYVCIETSSPSHSNSSIPNTPESYELSNFESV